MRLLGKPRTRHRPRAPQPDPVGQAARLSETPVAFAGAGRASTETGVAFAGEKLAFLVHFACAEVMLVSRLPCWGRAEVSLVSPSPPQCVLCAKKFALRRCVIVKTRKRSPCALKTPQNRRLMARWASFFAEMPLDERCWASFFAEMRLDGRCWAKFFADRQSWDPTGRVVLRRGPGSRPFCWRC